MTCKECIYCYKEDGEKYARCHFDDICGEPTWVNVPPCEEESEDSCDED